MDRKTKLKKNDMLICHLIIKIGKKKQLNDNFAETFSHQFISMFVEHKYMDRKYVFESIPKIKFLLYIQKIVK